MTVVNRFERSWRMTAAWMLSAVIGVAAVALVLDGGRPAVAAGDCQYQPYLPYGSDPCPPAEVTLTTTPDQTEALAGWWLGDRATLSGGSNPTGTLTFSLHPPGDTTCSTPAYTSQVAVAGGRDYYSWEGTTTGTPEATAVGVWRWKVHYSGDARNSARTSGCDDEQVAVSKAGLYLYLYPANGQAQSIPGGLSVYGGAGGYRPTGAVTVRLFGPDDPNCTGSPRLRQEFPFDGSSSVSLFASIASTDALGVWKWQADYPGDALNEAVAVPCGQTYHSVDRAQPSLSAGASTGSTEIGGAVSVGGSVSGGYRVGGAVTLRLFGPDDGGCGSVRETHQATIASDGTFATSFTPTEIGTWRVTADYPGDVLNTPASMTCRQLAFQATKATPFVVPAATPTTAEPGTRLQAMTLVGGGYGPTGRIAFRLYGPGDPTCSGIPAQIEEAAIAGTSAATTTGFVVQTVGTWRWTATYLGDSRNNTIMSSCDGARVAVVAKLPKPPSNPGGTPWETNAYFNCVDDHHIGVPDGGRLVLRVAWAAMTKKQIEGFLRGASTTAQVDGVPVQHADGYWSKAESDGAGGWVTRWIYDTGRVVTSSSAPFTVEFDVVATKALTDGTSTWDAGAQVIAIGGPCLVTAVAP